LWQRLCFACWPLAGPAFAFTDTVHIKTARYFRTWGAAVKGIEAASGDENVVSVSGPTSIGPWRCQWWRTFSEGYRIDIEERMRWMGRCGGAACIMYRLPEQADLRHLAFVLDRHNVTFAEWLLMSSMDEGGRQSASDLTRVAAFASEQFGVFISEGECREGLNACIGHGWLRVLDPQTIDEIRSLLRNDPRFEPVPSDVFINHGTIDFSPSGAAMYRMIAADWLGPAWEDEIDVCKEWFWEEHRYCETAEGLRDVVQEHVDRGRIVQARRVVPIGPWCVYWWERFPGGYRMELEIDDPYSGVDKLPQG
jgi:hypothetical protein